ncbi:MAG TPA: conjugal transfer protein TraB [Chryseobacterium indologenes]|nr:conjugal transfer protein TraB [Chryseobacterium indologenes]
MISNSNNDEFEKPDVNEEYLMGIIGGEEPVAPPNADKQETPKTTKPKEKSRNSPPKKLDYEEKFLANRFPSGRNGKVVYIRPEYHERLIRIVQLTREEKTTLYSYIDNILEHHFEEFEEMILTLYNSKTKPLF